MKVHESTESEWHAIIDELDELLGEMLNADIYRRNSFHVLGLPTTASAPAITARSEKRIALAQLGSSDPSLEGPFPIRPPSSAEDIRNAEHELRDPVRRIVHELFWLWPLNGGDGEQDPSFIALKAGDMVTASRIWTEAAKSPVTAPIARHNNAVRWHRTALGLEKTSQQTKDDPKARQRYERTWKSAIRLWDEVLASDVTWSVLAARVQTLHDERIPPQLIQELRSRTPAAFADINARLVAKSIAEGNAELATMQIALICNEKLGSISVKDFVESAISKLQTDLRAFQRANDPGVAGNERSGAAIASKLLGVLSVYYPCFESLAAHANIDSWRDVVDALIRRANLYAIAYVEKSGDSAGFAAVMRTAAGFVSGSDLSDHLDNSARSAIRKVAAAQLAPEFSLLNQIHESRDPPARRMALLEERVISRFPEVQRQLEQLGHSADEFSNNIAWVVRCISIDAWNKKRDAALAEAALDIAEKYVTDQDLSAKIVADRKGLSELVSAAASAKKQRVRLLAWRVAPLALVIVLIASVTGSYIRANRDIRIDAGEPIPPPAAEIVRPVMLEYDGSTASRASAGSGAAAAYVAAPHSNDSQGREGPPPESAHLDSADVHQPRIEVDKSAGDAPVIDQHLQRSAASRIAPSR